MPKLFGAIRAIAARRDVEAAPLKHQCEAKQLPGLLRVLCNVQLVVRKRPLELAHGLGTEELLSVALRKLFVGQVLHGAALRLFICLTTLPLQKTMDYRTWSAQFVRDATPEELFWRMKKEKYEKENDDSLNRRLAKVEELLAYYLSVKQALLETHAARNNASERTQKLIEKYERKKLILHDILKIHVVIDDDGDVAPVEGA